MVFDYDSWPGRHSNSEECIRYYKKSFYQLHNNYNIVFPEAEFAPDDENEVDFLNKVFKVTYSINILPQVDFHIMDDGEEKNKDMNFM